jgi:rhodanese-related sulfurtransferase
MNEFIVFLKTDWNAMWALAVVLTGSLWASTLLPTQHRRRSVNAQKAVSLMNNEDAVLLDVREKDEFVRGHIPGSRNTPLPHLKETIGAMKIDKSTVLVLSCASGQKSMQAFKTLIQQGYERVYLLDQGLAGWQTAGFPVVKKG